MSLPDILPTEDLPMGDHASAVSCTLLQQDRRGRLIPRADIPSGTKVMTSDRRIAGIGASAGGVEALEAFFKAVPQDNGIAFVVVTHLDPNRESMLAGILGRATPMPVVHARDGEPVEAQHVYVLPPGAILTIREGRLRLRPASSVDRERTPIDLFFSSLAEDQGEHAIGIVLSAMVNSLNLPIYVVGGGVASAWEAFAPTIFDELRHRCMVYAATAPPDPLAQGGGASSHVEPGPGRKTIITRALLGSDAGLFGAARLPMIAEAAR